MEKMEEIQKRLQGSSIQGWLLFDHHGSNKFIRELLDIDPDILITRRFFYWIPCQGTPVKIMHHIEADSLEHLAGKKELYISWRELQGILKTLLKKGDRIAMEYSPRGANPHVSLVDAGTMEMVLELGVEVISSADLLQHFTSVLDERQIESHFEAAKVVIKSVDRAWDVIADRLAKGKKITEYDVQQFILSEFLAAGCITEGAPICAVGENSSSPHYTPTRHLHKTIEKGDFILIDLWCKKDIPHGVYADITRVAVAGSEPNPQEQMIFDIVREAQATATSLVIERFKGHESLKGSEVDDLCRECIKKSGYGAFFTHRTGHSIDTHIHGGGAHLDNFEIEDHRTLLASTCFSIEPAIYLPHKFGVRLEHDILIDQKGDVHITGGTQEKIVCLL